MKTSKTNAWKPVCLSLIAAVMAFRAAADDASATAESTSTASAAVPEKNYTGTVDYLDKNEHVLHLKGWFAQRKAFNLGDSCAYSEPGSGNLPMANLRSGEKVTVTYQDRQGVLIADRVQQIPMRVEGTVTVIDPTNHLLTVHESGSNRKFQMAGDCQIVLRDGKAGGFDDVKTGSYVTVTYETPGDVVIAREIAQTSLEFSGMLTAIDLEDRTIKAKAVFGTKKFHLADNCTVVINGHINGRLADLRPEEKLVFSYDEINGVNVVNRIAPAQSQANPVATSGPAQGY